MHAFMLLEFQYTRTLHEMQVQVHRSFLSINQLGTIREWHEEWLIRLDQTTASHAAGCLDNAPSIFTI